MRPVDDPRAAVRGADIVGLATNSVTPVVEADWLAPHAHVSCVKELELGEGLLERCDRRRGPHAIGPTGELSW